VPDHIINRPLSAGLWLGQTDEEEMGFTYAELERYLEEGPQCLLGRGDIDRAITTTPGD
jgi:NH3-dependent NAD+ synthetase